jgi:hypothetical protein
MLLRVINPTALFHLLVVIQQMNRISTIVITILSIQKINHTIYDACKQLARGRTYKENSIAVTSKEE